MLAASQAAPGALGSQAAAAPKRQGPRPAPAAVAPGHERWCGAGAWGAAHAHAATSGPARRRHWGCGAVASSSGSLGSIQMSSMDEEEWQEAYGLSPLKYGVSLEQGVRETMEDAAQIVPHARYGFFMASEWRAVARGAGPQGPALPRCCGGRQPASCMRFAQAACHVSTC